jgi:hypothetical protein
VSPAVAPGKDSKEPGWEMDCVTYPLERNILYPIYDNDLWRMIVEKKACFMSFYVRALDSKNGKLAARQLLRKGI